MKELFELQNYLKVPKGNYNSFGKYNYRSCEDILEAVKPLLYKYRCYLTITDDIISIGDRIYVKATVTLKNESGAEVSTTAFAREEDAKKGMDGSQVTGAASSYARKYALNGLFCIDDTKDSDVTNLGDNTDDTELGKALKEIGMAKSIDGLSAIYEKYKSLHSNRVFMNNLSERKKELK